MTARKAKRRLYWVGFEDGKIDIDELWYAPETRVRLFNRKKDALGWYSDVRRVELREVKS